MGGIVLLAARSAHADEPSPEDLAEARTAFFEAIAREEANDLEGALASYERARAHAVSPQLLFNIAALQEKLHRLATARRTFELARDEAARRGNDEVLAEAKVRLAALAKTVPRIVIRLHESAAGARVSLDGADVDSITLGTPIELDPGKHRVFARRDDDERSFELTFEAQPSSERVIDVEIGVRHDDLAPPPKAPERTAPPPIPRNWAAAGIAGGTTLALGVAALATGLVGHTKRNRFVELNANPSPGTLAEREELRADGQGLFTANAVLTGAAILAGGATVYFLVRTLRAPSSRIALPSAFASPAGVSISFGGAL